LEADENLPQQAVRQPEGGLKGPWERKKQETGSDLSARGEPFLWGMGGALGLGLAMIFLFLLIIAWNGLATFYPRPIFVLTLKDGAFFAGEPVRTELYKPARQELEAMDENTRKAVLEQDGFAERTLYRIGNFDLYNEDFAWIAAHRVKGVATPREMVFVERVEWGPFIGTVEAVVSRGERQEAAGLAAGWIEEEHGKAVARRSRIRGIERNEIGAINHKLEQERLTLRRLAMQEGEESRAYRKAEEASKARIRELETRYSLLTKEADSVKRQDAQYKVILKDIGGREKELLLSQVVRFYRANDLTFLRKAGIYLSRWMEFLSAEPREANTEGGVFPAIFGTFVMTVLLALVVAPFGVMAALYLREYARQGRLVSAVRICVNNLAGVPSIVYGVFGLGFFAYIIGATIDEIFFPERLPSPTFGTGGVLWASLTLALLTVPVVIVSTEEALAAVPQSMREGSLACGASKWQTIRNIVLPKAMPGIMTGLILAMARGAGEVAPLMLVGVVKLAPSLPVDMVFPFFHLERSFMHLGFHIYDVGFQSRNSEAGKPMVFVTTLLLIALVAGMNATAVYIRNRLKKRYYVGHF
jgi:phosphate transport system permease protein